MAHFYIDPAGPRYRPPNLVERLMRIPSRRAHAPHENQITETLAWLLDRSPTLARRFAELFFEGDDDATAALARAKHFGTRTQLSLSVPDRGTTVFPDLSLAGDERTFELLVEVKVDADPHAFEAEEGTWLLQPDWYAQAWDVRPEASQAAIRRVGTLTRGFSFPVLEASPTRGRDVTWTEVETMFGSCLGELEPDVAAVASDFLDVVRRRILGIGNELPEPGYVDALLTGGRDLLLAIGERLRGSLPVWGADKCVRKHDYQGTFFKAQTPDGIPLNLWLIVVPAGGRYNTPGAPDCVRVRVFEQPKELTDERVLSGGFVWEEDAAGYRDFQLHWPIETNEGRIVAPEALADEVAVAIAEALRSCQPPLVEAEAPP